MTTQYHQSHRCRALEANLLGVGVAMALAAPAFLAAPSAATAAPITYDLSPSVKGDVPGGTDTVTGTFTFDPTGSPFGGVLDSVDLTVTGPFHPGTYDAPEVPGGPGPLNEIDVVMTPPTAGFSLIFHDALGNAPDDVTEFNWFSPTLLDITPTQGIAVPVPTGVPEPATWVMALLGFAGLAFAGRRARSGLRLAA
jgi:hypothetical protein